MLTESASSFNTQVAEKPQENRGPPALIVCMADVKAKPIEWFWDGRVPRGAVTIIDGDPGLGKSTLSIDLAARASRGYLMPPEPGPCQGAEPEGVLLVNCEDDSARTIKPRLTAAGADMNWVHVLNGVQDRDGPRDAVFPLDVVALVDAIRQRDIRLVIIDPIMGHLGSDVDAHKDQDVRRCMRALRDLAESTGIAIVLIRHLNKCDGRPAIYRGGGSIGILGAARSALLVGRHPKEPETIVVASTKSNLGPKPEALGFKLVSVGRVAKIEWTGAVDLEADELLANVRHKKPKKPEQCAEFIEDYLEEHGPTPSADLDKACEEAGFSERGMKGGRKLLGSRIKTDKASMGGGWVVSMAEDEGPAAVAGKIGAA
jgi:archaellum biogenesis ATPase FlaH